MDALEKARATNKRLNRRVQEYEAALAEKIATYPHRSFGRALANAAATMYEALAAALMEDLREIERHCPCGARPESPDTHPHVGGCPVARALARTPALSPTPLGSESAGGPAGAPRGAPEEDA